MIWLVVATGLLIAAFGATAGAAEPATHGSRQLGPAHRDERGATPSLAWLAVVDAHLTAASAPTCGRTRPCWSAST